MGMSFNLVAAFNEMDTGLTSGAQLSEIYLTTISLTEPLYQQQ